MPNLDDLPFELRQGVYKAYLVSLSAADAEAKLHEVALLDTSGKVAEEALEVRAHANMPALPASRN